MGFINRVVVTGVACSTAVAVARRAGVVTVDTSQLDGEKKKFVESYLWVGERGADFGASLWQGWRSRCNTQQDEVKKMREEMERNRQLFDRLRAEWKTQQQAEEPQYHDPTTIQRQQDALHHDGDVQSIIARATAGMTEAERVDALRRLRAALA
mmetsp:Transcript_57264/g.131938  ORF Transcript_57264/g.131938 Transcript_57264/m.131938 type:complete len:154 (+) Transcript_57264:42-503(+)